MCLVALALDPGGRFPFVLASNRDEFHERPSAALAWWTPEPGAPALLSGRDLRAGGTWLGLNAAGRLALVTNVRRGGSTAPGRPSRGQLVTRWLRDDSTPQRYWAEVQRSGCEAFNLVAADVARGDWFYASSDGSPPRRLRRGLHGLSNAALDTPWPKVERLKQRLRESLMPTAPGADAESLARRLLDALADRRTADDDQLPATGVPFEWEKRLSAAFITTPDGSYGTRCSTVVIAERVADACSTHVFERSFTPHGDVAGMRHERVAERPPAARPSHR